jgi:D-alanyl-D-alanine carboxypeptidase/D-alanyl-D-alanine-endopeptidase (penicillin-binding protein 4)
MMKRLKENAVTGRAHLKTGSLDNVRSVAGYILDDAGHRWVFVGMVNHPRAAAVREGMDALIDWVSSGALVNLQ